MLRRLVEAGLLFAPPGGPKCPTPIVYTYRLWCSREEPSGEGVRPRPRCAAGRQRQGPHPAYARAWSGRNRQPGQHKGPITRTFLEVLEALLWGFHNSRTGCCFPSYERIAEKADCARSTVAEALKALEWCGVLTWQHRITRAVVRQRDLFGRWSSRWTVIRTSNAYVFSDPQGPLAGVPAAKSENPPGTLNQEILFFSTDHDRPGQPAGAGSLPDSVQRSQHKKCIEQGRKRQHDATGASSDGAGRSSTVP